jgi:hypothetical protein
MLNHTLGRLGMLGLPWLLVGQLILAAIGSIVDPFLVWLVLNGDRCSSSP